MRNCFSLICFLFNSNTFYKASSNSNIENLTLEESRMGSAMSECLRDMLSNSEIIELLKMGCMKKLKAAGNK